MKVLMGRNHVNEATSTATFGSFLFTPDDPTVGTPYIQNDDGEGNIKVKILTSGTLHFYDSFYVDWFAVGGGGSGGATSSFTGGGGGGYTTTVLNYPIRSGAAYTVTIGAGGTAGANSDGGASSVTETYGEVVLGEGITEYTNTVITANGGKYGKSRAGGAGGSGGGGGSYGNSQKGGNGGSDGSNGTKGSGGSAGAGGAGQGTTTRAFGETDGELFAGGGGGGSANNGSYTAVALGGDGGGGNGNNGTADNATSGTPNTGGGGGGAAANRVSGAGGSGIVIVRFAKAFVG